MVHNGYGIYLDTIPTIDNVFENIVINHQSITASNPTRARIVIVLHPSDNTDLSFIASSN